MSHRFDPYNDEAFWDEVSRDSERRRAQPLQFALEALEDLFRYETDKERGLVRWQLKIDHFLWWADDAIQCLEQVLAAPPQNLGELILDHGIKIWIATADGETVGDPQAHVAWLRAKALRMREMFDGHVAAKTAEMTADPDTGSS